MATHWSELPFALLLHFAFVLAGLLTYAVGTHASGQRRHPSAALAWVLTIALLPYLGLPLYLMLGTRKFSRPSVLPVQAAHRQLDNTLQNGAMATLQGMGLAPPESHARICFHSDGQAAWDELVALINSAQTQLDICTFVLGNDAHGQHVARLLEKRTAQGVRVRLLLDAVGSWRTSGAMVRRLRASGVLVVWYMPVLFNLLRGRGNMRNHRKLAIADGQRFWSGGRNLAAEYFTGKHHKRPWKDLSFTMDGPLAAQAQTLFSSHWHHSQGPQTLGYEAALNLLPTTAPLTARAPLQHLAQMVPSGPDQAEDTFSDLLLTALFRARKQVLAVTPYFVPDETLLKALCLAARRGVQVELIMPARSNHRLADFARARALRDLVAAGGQVRLATSMVHAKVVVIDDALALCGSLNLDARSLFLNYELMVAFYDSQDISIVTQWIKTNFHNLPSYHPSQPSLGRDIAEGLVRWLGFQI